MGARETRWPCVALAPLHERGELKTATIHIPVTVVVPQRYAIEIILDGPNSFLALRETYPEDIPPGLIDTTLKILGEMEPFKSQGKLEKVSEQELVLRLSGSESQIAQVMIGEFQMVADAYRPSFPQIASRTFTVNI